MKHRVGCVEGEILRELTKILRRDIHDPCLSDITITAIECTNDLSYATIYYSLSTEDPTKGKEVAEGFDKARGMMRHLFSQALTVYKVPGLIFKHDTSIACGSKVDNLISRARK